MKRTVYKGINLELTHAHYTYLLPLSALPRHGMISVYNFLTQMVSTIRNIQYPISPWLVNDNMEIGMTLSNWVVIYHQLAGFIKQSPLGLKLHLFWKALHWLIPLSPLLALSKIRMKIITGSKGELQDIYKVELKANLHKGCRVDFF